MTRWRLLVVGFAGLFAACSGQDTNTNVHYYDLSAIEDLAMAAETVSSTGYISVYGYSFTTGGIPISGGGAAASFTTTTYPADLSCVKTTVSNCQVQNCNGNLFGTTQTDDSVGPFSVTVGGTTYNFAPDGTNQYQYAPASPRPFPQPGNFVTFTLPGLNPINEDEPDEPSLVDPFTPTVILESVDGVPVPTTGGSAGSLLTITLSGSSSATNSVTVTCTGDPSAGTVAVPPAVAQMVPKGMGTVNVSVAAVSAPFMFMGHTTTVQASTDVLLPSGDNFGGAQVTFQ